MRGLVMGEKKDRGGAGEEGEIRWNKPQTSAFRTFSALVLERVGKNHLKEEGSTAPHHQPTAASARTVQVEYTCKKEEETTHSSLSRPDFLT